MRIGPALALVLAALPATADARTFELRPLGHVAVAADGGRYVVTRRVPRVGPPPSWLRVRDERTGRRFRITGVPAGCDEPVVGGRRLVMRCPTPEPPNHPHPHVWNLAHPERPPIEVPAALPYGVIPDFHFTAIGRRWIAVRIYDDHAMRRGLVERATGRFVADPSDRPHAVPDLDAASGRQPLCAPITRRRFEPDYPDTWPRFVELAYERPYAAEIVLGAGGERVVLRRCGSQRPRVLSRCVWWNCGEPIVAGGAVAWTDDRRVHALVLRTGRRRTWRMPRAAADDPHRLSLSRRHVYFGGGWVGTLPGR